MAEENRKIPEDSTRNVDIQDSFRDKERLKPDKATLDLPDVKDIPGQEHIHIPRMGELADTTISSDDEEGVGVFEDDEEDEMIILMGSANDIPKEDKAALENMDNLDVFRSDDILISRGMPDNADADGDELNEKTDVSGNDLDTAGVDEDDADESIGEEDEENNQYSLGSDSEQEGGTRG
ncbi:MAG TPA: hypothetical protein VM101_16850 [Flavitalea sp.]|nr:hypothetical protein [Flavitalea sp.]